MVGKEQTLEIVKTAHHSIKLTEKSRFVQRSEAACSLPLVQLGARRNHEGQCGDLVRLRGVEDLRRMTRVALRMLSPAKPENNGHVRFYPRFLNLQACPHVSLG